MLKFKVLSERGPVEILPEAIQTIEPCPVKPGQYIITFSNGVEMVVVSLHNCNLPTKETICLK